MHDKFLVTTTRSKAEESALSAHNKLINISKLPSDALAGVSNSDVGDSLEDQLICTVADSSTQQPTIVDFDSVTA